MINTNALTKQIAAMRVAGLAYFRFLTPMRQLQLKRIGFVSVGFAVSLMISEPAYAQNLEGLATRLLSLLSNRLLATIATIAVIIAGAAMWTGRIEKATFFTILFGIVIVFSAAFIVSTISGV